MEILGEYLRWPRSDLGSGFRPGWGSFHKLPGPSRGPRSKGLAPLPSVSGPFGGLIRRCSFIHPRRRGCYVGGRGPLLVPTRGGATRHPPSGARYVGTRDPLPPRLRPGVVSSESRGFPPHIPHLRARVSQARGRCLTASDRPRGQPRDSYPLPPPPFPRGSGLEDLPSRGSVAREDPGARERPRVGAHKPPTAGRWSGVRGLP